MIKVLFVCTGNICRSPAGHGVFEAIVKREGKEKLFEIDSAGLISFHEGEKPDSRTLAHAKKRGYDFSYQRSRPITARDFKDYDYILAMDSGHYKELLKRAPSEFHHKIHMMLSFSNKWKDQSVADPYYADASAFELVMDQMEESCEILFKELSK
jgi:protein-tyrosine phosphatase